MATARNNTLARSLMVAAISILPMSGCDPDALADIIESCNPPAAETPESGLPADAWAERGRLLGYQYMRTLTQAEIQQAQFDVPFADSYADFGIDNITDFYTEAEIDDVVRHNVDVYRVFYETIDPFGAPTVASGAVLIPQVEVFPEDGLNLWGLMRGTIFFDADAPSHGEMPDFGIWRGLLPASAGYVTAMPDYLGFGASRAQIHTYAIAEPTATAAVDMLRATRHLADALALPLREEIFVSGHSQGGHAALATLRTLEAEHGGEFDVAAATASSGSYAISGIFTALLNSETLIAPQVTSLYTVVLTGVYGLEPLDHYFTPPYDELILDIHDKTNTNAEIIAALPTGDIEQLYAPEFLEAFRGDGEQAFKQAVALNDLHTGWNPQAPLRLYHGDLDATVPLIQSQVTLSGLSNEDTQIDLEIVEGADHLQTIVPSTLRTIHWFDSIAAED